MRRVIFVVFLCITLLVCVTEARIKALVTAGSNGYYNYRHQADALHGWQILRRNGVDEEDIVLMAYGDIAYNSENPTPGVIVNNVNSTVNVFAGAQIDYSREAVSPKNFLNALTSKSASRGKVLNSSDEDDVVVLFHDHGAVGLLAFPNGEVLHSHQLIAAIKETKFRSMLLLIEACESGSMFAGGLLPHNRSVLAVTASWANESSWACCYSNFYQTYLGDTFSVNFLDYLDNADTLIEPIRNMFAVARNETDMSHVSEYGHKGVGTQRLDAFVGAFGGGVRNNLAVWRRPAAAVAKDRTQVDSRDAVLVAARRRGDSQTVQEILGVRQRMQTFVDALATRVPTVRAEPRVPVNSLCIERAVDAATAAGLPMRSEFSLPYVRYLASLCDTHAGRVESLVGLAAAAAAAKQ